MTTIKSMIYSTLFMVCATAHAESPDDAYVDGVVAQQRNDYIDQQYQTQMRAERETFRDEQRQPQTKQDDWLARDQPN